MSWNWAALTPHPPVIVPEVGRGREKDAALTLSGMGKLVSALRGMARPDCLFLLSPHQPYMPGSLFLNAAPRLIGSLAGFGAPAVLFDADTPLDALSALTAHLKHSGIPVRTGEVEDLTDDQGSLVPLYYLEKAWGSLPPLILASPIGLHPGAALRLGQALADLKPEGNWAMLASGDLSHRLRPGAPAGYDPAGEEFDEAVLKALKTGDTDILTGMTPQTIERAGECGLRSALAFLGLCLGLGEAPQLLSYEAPFGVGYCTAFCRKSK